MLEQRVSWERLHINFVKHFGALRFHFDRTSISLFSLNHLLISNSLSILHVGNVADPSFRNSCLGLVASELSLGNSCLEISARTL